MLMWIDALLLLFGKCQRCTAARNTLDGEKFDAKWCRIAHRIFSFKYEWFACLEAKQPNECDAVSVYVICVSVFISAGSICWIFIA